MYKKIALAGACLLALSTGACATITRGTQTDWNVDSTPSGAAVETSNGYRCAATPCALRMPRNSEFTATITKEGYEPATIAVTHVLASGGTAGFVGNVLAGGVIGMAVDGTNGATQDLSPNPAMVTLTPKPAGAGGGGIRQFFSDLFGR
jgi:hypothetical protein